MKNNVNEIKSKITVPEYLQRYVGMSVRENSRISSPIRAGATNPTSFSVQRDFWWDFGGGFGGDVIDLCARHKYGGDVGKAIRFLAQETGVAPDDNYSQWRKYTQDLCNQIAYWHTQLTDADREYLHSRRISDDTISRYRIGRNEEGRLVIPYYREYNGPVVYYATRAMPGCKYPDSKYRKMAIDSFNNHCVFGLDTLNTDRRDVLFIAEGAFDALSTIQAGYPTISAITGRFSKQQLTEVIAIAKMFDQVIICYDDDSSTSNAGEHFTIDMAKILFRNKIPFRVGTTPNYHDISEYYAAGNDISLIISNAKPGMSFIASLSKTIDELKNFIFSVNRYCDQLTIADIINSCADKFPARTLDALIKISSKPPSESTVADEIIKKHNVIYLNNIGFYEWDGRIWCKISDNIIRNYADQTYGKQFTTAQRVGAVCNLLKARTVREITFDRKPVLTFQNGTLEIETGVFRGFSELDYCSIIMDYDYNPNADSPVWDNFIRDVTNDEPISQENLQMIAGYVLFPDCKYQQVFILMGDGGNGKSVYLEVIQKIFGDKNVTHVEPNGLTAEFQRILLKDSLLNIGSDINSDFSRGEIREWLLKIADGTSIQACYKGMTHIDFIPRCKLIYACNMLPTADIINGLNRRLRFVNFPCRYVEYPNPNNPLERPRDVNIISKLLRELPGIFNWAYHGYQLLRKVNYFTDNPDQQTLLSQFETISNPVAVFCDDITYTGKTDRDTIYYDYQLWCEKTGHKSLSREKFMPKFRDCMSDRIISETRKRNSDGKLIRVFEFASTL